MNALQQTSIIVSRPHRPNIASHPPHISLYNPFYGRSFHLARWIMEQRVTVGQVYEDPEMPLACRSVLDHLLEEPPNMMAELNRNTQPASSSAVNNVKSPHGTKHRMKKIPPMFAESTLVKSPDIDRSTRTRTNHLIPSSVAATMKRKEVSATLGDYKVSTVCGDFFKMNSALTETDCTASTESVSTRKMNAVPSKTMRANHMKNKDKPKKTRVSLKKEYQIRAILTRPLPGTSEQRHEASVSGIKSFGGVVGTSVKGPVIHATNVTEPIASSTSSNSESLGINVTTKMLPSGTTTVDMRRKEKPTVPEVSIRVFMESGISNEATSSEVDRMTMMNGKTQDLGLKAIACASVDISTQHDIGSMVGGLSKEALAVNDFHETPAFMTIKHISENTGTREERACLGGDKPKSEPAANHEAATKIMTRAAVTPLGELLSDPMGQTKTVGANPENKIGPTVRSVEDGRLAGTALLKPQHQVKLTPFSESVIGKLDVAQNWKITEMTPFSHTVVGQEMISHIPDASTKWNISEATPSNSVSSKLLDSTPEEVTLHPNTARIRKNRRSKRRNRRPTTRSQNYKNGRVRYAMRYPEPIPSMGPSLAQSMMGSDWQPSKTKSNSSNSM